MLQPNAFKNEISDYRPNDFAGVVALHLAGFRDAYPSHVDNPDSMKANLESPEFEVQLAHVIGDKTLEDHTSIFVVRTSDDTIASTVGLTISEDHLYGELWGVQVAKKFQGLGLAKKMVQHAIKDSEMRGLRSLNLHIVANSEPATKLYTGLGFATVEGNTFVDNCPRWSEKIGKAKYVKMERPTTSGSKISPRVARQLEDTYPK